MLSSLKMYYCLLVPLAGLLLSCQPAALPIDVQQEAPKIALATSVIDANTVLVSVLYSTNSLNTINTQGVIAGSATDPVAKLSVSSALVVLNSSITRDTLRQFYPGLYVATSLNLKPYAVYTLTVHDKITGSSVTGSCSYIPVGIINEIEPTVSRTDRETTVSLHVDVMDDPNQTDYYVMSYSNSSPTGIPHIPSGSYFQILDINSSKKLELFSDADAVRGRIVRDFILDIELTDTLHTSVSRIEKGFFDYLTAYKRTGSVLIDLSTEPITIPTNVVPGLGYFFLSEPKRSSFILASY